MLRTTIVCERGIRFRFVGWVGFFSLVMTANIGQALAGESAVMSPPPTPATSPATPVPLGHELTLEPEMARHMAGTWGDPSKVLGDLPGVAPPAPASDGISAWGARADETRVLVDGVEAPALLHLGGLRAAMGANGVGRLVLVPGAYGALHGRALGGLVLVETRELPAAGVHAVAEGSLLDASLLVAAAPSTRFRFGVAGTWSYLDHYHARLDEATTTFYQVPRYRDFQAKAELDVAPQRRLTLLVLGAVERVRPSQEPSGPPPPDLVAGNDWLLQRARTWSRIAIRYADDRDQRSALMAFVGWTDESVELAPWVLLPASQRLRAFHYGERASQDIRMAAGAVLTLSLDALVTRTRGTLVGDASFPPREEDVRYFGEPAVGNAYTSAHWAATVGDLAAGLGMRWQVGHWTVAPSVRADVYPRFVDRDPQIASIGDVSKVALAVGPRVSVAYAPVPAIGVHVAAGLYSEPPNAADLNQTFGNPSLGPAHAGHASLGLRWRLGSSASAEATGFFRQSWDLAARNPLPIPPPGQGLVNDGRARAYGGQLMLRMQVSARLDAWLAYTLSRSEMRFPGGDDLWRLAPQDRTHVLTGVFAYWFWGWVASARFRCASGAPYTPVRGSSYAASMNRYLPIFGPQNSVRLPAFVQADLRIERELQIAGTKASLFFEIVNLGSHDNPEAVIYSFDFRRSAFLGTAEQSYFLGARWQL